MEHLLNCHGEWTAFSLALVRFPCYDTGTSSTQGGNLITDIVIGLQHGDEGKGKVTHHLLKRRIHPLCSI